MRPDAPGRRGPSAAAATSIGSLSVPVFPHVSSAVTVTTYRPGRSVAVSQPVRGQLVEVLAGRTVEERRLPTAGSFWNVPGA